MVRVVVAVMMMVWLAAPELLSDPSNCAPQNLICYKPCCEAAFLCLMNCSWEVGCKEDVKHTLHLRDQAEGEISTFEVGDRTHFIFNTDTVYAQRNFTVWVESVPRNSSPQVSKNYTLLIKEATINISRSKGILTLKWPGSSTCRSTLSEVRMRQFSQINWTLGNCSSDDTTEELIVATCHLEKNIRYEVQVRYRTDHWSSHWSSWSEILFVPYEILRSPTVNYTVESLGKEGQRNVTLQWARPSVEEGAVSYYLTFVMLACKQCFSGFKKYSSTVNSTTSYHTALSAAEYNISLVAFNKVGHSPAYSFKLPPEQNAVLGPNFLNVNLSGRHYTLKWEGDKDFDHFCFEAQPLGENLPKEDCMRHDNTYLVTGEIESNKCYRFAVYKYIKSWNIYTWTTFGYTYLFHRNASLEDAIHVNVTNQTANSAVIQWKPPRPLSDCPGLLKKYIICCQKEQYGNITYYDVNVSQTRYTIQNLQPDTFYLVGIWVSTANSKDNCKTFYRFLTKAPDPKQLPLVLSFLFMGILGGILFVTTIFYLGKKRMKKSLCPALPDPANTDAVKFHTTAETGQPQVKLDFMEPMEANSPMQPLVVEPSSDKEEPVTDTAMELLGFVKGTEEEHSPKEDEVVSDEILFSEYKGQRFLSPVEESEDFVGVSHVSCTGDGPHLFLNNTEAGNQNGICMFQVPLSFKLFDKLVVIKNVGEGFDIPCRDGTSTQNCF
ncbi:interleukin-12 receptor subunit beta-1 isoform X2 [Ahaetulla prasina]|uniref:interleukin-12 receptor subunit beta-1 isoform X2 n=1 Tax=Ahaetulla prasina TaxID=499056 RepID=UPI00264A2DFF|nr:interleukin-12 receptor subunit beta-1 isoform X2 [Ahaetulla prasina]